VLQSRSAICVTLSNPSDTREPRDTQAATKPARSQAWAHLPKIEAPAAQVSVCGQVRCDLEAQPAGPKSSACTQMEWRMEIDMQTLRQETVTDNCDPHTHTHTEGGEGGGVGAERQGEEEGRGARVVA